MQPDSIRKAIEVVVRGKEVKDRLENAAFQAGLSLSQYEILSLLRDGQPTATMAVAEAVPWRKADLSKEFAILEAKGYTSQRRSEEDARVKEITITPEGRTILRLVEPLIEEAAQTSWNT